MYCNQESLRYFLALLTLIALVVVFDVLRNLPDDLVPVSANSNLTFVAPDF